MEKKSRMDNPEKLGIKGTQDENKTKPTTTRYMLDTTILCYQSICKYRYWTFCTFVFTSISSNKLMNYVFLSPSKTITFLRCLVYATSVENITYDCFDTTMRKQTQIT